MHDRVAPTKYWSWLPLSPRNSIKQGIKGVLLPPRHHLIVRHCFSERLIKVRKYGLAGRVWEEQGIPLRINDGGYRSCPGVGRGRRVVRYRGRDRRSIVPAVNKSLMIPGRALPRPLPTTTNYTRRRYLITERDQFQGQLVINNDYRGGCRGYLSPRSN